MADRPANSGRDEPVAPLDVVVLYVEDDPMTQRPTATLLGRRVRAVHTAPDGQEGLIAFSRIDPDIVVTDVMMPKMDGIAMAAHIKAMKPEAQVIVATSFDDTDILRRAIQAGVDEYVLKPVEANVLYRALERCHRRVAERRKLRDQRRQSELMLGGLPHPAMLVDRPSRKVLASNARAEELGYLPGVECAAPLFPDGLPPEPPDNEAFSPAPYRMTGMRGVASGDRFWDISLVPVSPTTLLAYAIDVTEQRRLQQLKDDVERMIRHDMKTPLSGIIGMAQILMESDLDQETTDNARVILDSGRQILDMIDRSMDLYRMEEGTYRLKAGRVDLALVLSRLKGDLSQTATLRGARLAFRLNDKPWDLSEQCFVHGEVRLLEALFGNLMLNAVEAAPPESTVTLSLHPGKMVLAEIHNLGAVPPEIRDRFFERYATWGKEKGTGLGTYTARLFAKVHGGDVTMATSETEGTSVVVTLPGGGLD